MPTYVYGCDTCGHRFEIFQKFQDVPLTECPACGARIRKIIQPAGIVFKGSGWYSTDSRANKAGSSATESGSADKDSRATPSGDGAAKPAAKESSKPEKSSAPAGATE
jgi:putative FmdB family regulatory protein